jgi:lipoate-protein ligase A
MRYIEGINNRSDFNLAMEQYVFDYMPRSDSYFLLWQNAPSVIIGKYQNAYEEVNNGYITEHNIPVIRRLSGGGAVYHDLGNINYTFIVDGNIKDKSDLDLFCEPLIATLAKFGIKAEISGRNDITIDGMKISGTARYNKENRIMHHGTILYDANLEIMPKILCPSKGKMASKGIKSVRSRVTNIKEYMDVQLPTKAFCDVYRQQVFDYSDVSEIKFTEQDLKNIEEIRRERYGSWEWNWGESPKSSIVKEEYIPDVGKIKVYMEIVDGKIKECSFYGDFFGQGPSSELIDRLIGCSLNKNDLLNALETTNVGSCFYNLSKVQLADFLIE